MKKIFFIFLLLIFVQLSGDLTAFADPRMEINKNFCHFILDPNNTDNEVFMAGCNAEITVTENVATASQNIKTVPENIKDIGSLISTACEENYVASGYSIVKKWIPVEAAPLLPTTSIVITSNDSEYPCTMVESNGRAYKSYKWRSTIKAGWVQIIGRGADRREFVQITYELFCQDGH
jgi:hypothetical protein